MLEVALRSTIILAAAWILTRLMWRSTAATRHLVWHTALVAVVIAPALAPFAPRVPLPGISEVALLAQLPLRPALTPIRNVDDGVQAGNAEAVTAATTAPTPATAPGRFPRSLGTIGTCVVTLWFAAGWISAARLRRRARPAPVAWQLELNALRERLRIPGEVRLAIVDEHTSPLAAGLLRATILLPEAAASWSADRRRAVLLHELAHVRRRDCRVQLVAQAACAMYWFNPFIWFAAAQLRSERERACDDTVLRLGAQPSSYAAHLLDIARELRPQLRPSAALAMARPSELEGRLLSVLAAGRARVPARGTRWVVVIALSITTVAVMGATVPPPQPERSADIVTSSPPHYVVGNDVARTSEPTAIPRAREEATLQSSADPQDRERATLALAFTSGRDVIPALLHALGDSDAQVREKAAIGLALRRDERVVEPLIAAMSDPDSQVREKAAIALGTSGDERARDALTRALEDPDSQVREKAAAGLILFSLTK